MRRASTSIISVLAAVILGSASGCGFPPNRTGFIEKLASQNRQIARSTRPFHSAVLQLKSGQAADAGQVRAGYQEMEKTLKEAQTTMDGQSLPASSSSAKPFLSAYKAYLKEEQRILTEDLQPIVKKIEESGSPAEKWAFVDGQLNKAAAEDRAALAPVLEAQKSYASEHNYTVQTLSTYLEAQKNGKQ
jgi:hypothetical protein